MQRDMILANLDMIRLLCAASRLISPFMYTPSFEASKKVMLRWHMGSVRRIPHVEEFEKTY
jgi:hypothetical protein